MERKQDPPKWNTAYMSHTPNFPTSPNQTSFQPHRHAHLTDLKLDKLECVLIKQAADFTISVKIHWIMAQSLGWTATVAYYRAYFEQMCCHIFCFQEIASFIIIINVIYKQKRWVVPSIGNPHSDCHSVQLYRFGSKLFIIQNYEKSGRCLGSLDGKKITMSHAFA